MLNYIKTGSIVVILCILSVGVVVAGLFLSLLLTLLMPFLIVFTVLLITWFIYVDHKESKDT